MKRFQTAESPSAWSTTSHLGSSDDALLMGTLPETPSALNRSSASNASFASATTASSSKAVLAALRALQDKIRRLEAERTQALDEASELRSKLRSYEIESEHSRQRESLQSQRQLLEARSENERLLDSKAELEDRLKRLEDRNRDSEMQLTELSSQISRLVEAKANSDTKIRDLTTKAQLLENQLESAQNREKELTQAMIREAKMREEELSTNRSQTERVAAELGRVTAEKVTSEAKLSELDHLVGQLLSVNEALLQQLSGSKIVIQRKKHPLSTDTTNSMARQKPPVQSTVISRILQNDAQKVAASQLMGMHEMYKSLAKSIVNNSAVESKATGTSKTKKSTKTKTTRMAKKSKGADAAVEKIIKADGAERKKVNVQVRPGTVPLRFPDMDFAGLSSDYGAGGEYQDVIASLEKEFDELNDQYHRLLSSSSGSATATKSSEVTRSKSDELVNVIQKLHTKGEQLRALKSPPRA